MPFGPATHLPACEIPVMSAWFQKLHQHFVGRLLLYVMLPMLLVFAANITLNSLSLVGQLRRASEERLKQRVALIAADIDRDTLIAVISAQRMAEAQAAGMFGDRLASLEFARRVLEDTPGITGAYFGYERDADGKDAASLAELPATSMDPAGRFIPYWFVGTGPGRKIALEPLVDMESSLYYQGAKEEFLKSKKASPKITEPYVYQGKMIYEQTFPIVIDGEFRGVAGVDRALADVETPLRRIAADEQLDFFLISGHGKFIAATTDPADASGASLEGLLKTQPVADGPYAGLLGDMLRNRRARSVTRDRDPVTDATCYYAVAALPTGGWNLVLRATEASVMGPIWRQLALRLAMGVSMLLAVLSLLYLFARAFSRRIDRAVSIANCVAQGDLNVPRVVEAARDESGVLLRSIGGMTENLNSLVGAVKQASLHLNATATQISASAGQQNATMQGFNASTSEIAASIKQISSTGQELLETVEDLQRRTAATAALAGAGQAGLTSMENSMGSLAGATGSISTKLGMIREKAGGINAVVETITKVADQTNLLSINAAIEAEKAGEAGRGFLVVAREIRRLADQTAVATLDIEQMVRQMQDAVSAGVMEMDKFSEQVRTGIGQVNQIGGQMAEIIDQVQVLSGQFPTVSEGMRQQSQGARQIDEAMAQLVTGVHQVSETVKDFNAAAENLRLNAGALQSQVGQFTMASQ